MEQLDSIYSLDRKRGHPADLITWGQLGLKGDWAGHPINRYGGNSASGVHAFIKAAALKGGNFKDTVKEMSGSASVIQAVTASGVRKLKVAEKAGSRFIAAEKGTVHDGTFPLRRFFHVVINKSPGKPISPVLREFCSFLSKQGQEIVDKDGYIPVSPAIVKEQLKKAGIEE